MLLVPGIQQACGKAVETVLRGDGAGQGKTALIAVAAAGIPLIVRDTQIVHHLEPAGQIIHIVLPQHGQVHLFRHLFHRLPPPKIFGNGMDVRIGEVSRDVIALVAQRLDAHDAARPATGVQEHFLAVTCHCSARCADGPAAVLGLPARKKCPRCGYPDGCGIPFP